MANLDELLAGSEPPAEKPTDVSVDKSDAGISRTKRRAMPDTLNAFEPGWTPPRPWFFPLADPIHCAELEEARKKGREG